MSYMLNEFPCEASTEEYLVARIKALGGKCLKFVSPGTAGVLDRLVLLPGGTVLFVEVKRLGELPSALQEKFMFGVLHLGTPALTVDSRQEVDELVQQLLSNGLVPCG